ncbi:GNAT family N-acetyltransferase [Brevibacterium casei]|uniref:GNAT family N-acetyltransferase n=1 Tax=Brevibacterium casei TaxID=33889 RepID=UPI003158DBBC
MEITHIRAGALSESEIEDTVAEVVAFDLLVNSASGLGPDFDPRPGEVRRQLQRTNDYLTHAVWLGRLGGDIVARGIAYLSLKDNEDAAEIHVSVHPEHRRQGLGSELLSAMEEQLAAEGRRTLTSFGESPVRVVEENLRDARVAAASGTGALPSTLPEVAFARAHGYSLRQLERCSVARIREAGGGLGAEDDGGDGYTILTWAGPTPEEHLEALALLQRRMSTDTPGAADLEEEEFWDADRVRANDADREASGKRLMTALAMKGDEVAGYTQAAHFADRPEVGDQGGTLVIREHRGHRLGARLKRANHEALLQESAVERVYTWNAAENTWMLAINDLAGFETFAWTSVWKKVLPTGATAGE